MTAARLAPPTGGADTRDELHGGHETGDAARPLSLDEALGRMLAGVEPLPRQDVALVEADARVLAAPAVSLLTLPRWDNSSMDGFALRSRDVARATETAPVELVVTGEAAAGQAPAVAVEPGRAVRILTGAMIPDGADAVVALEATDARRGATALPQRVKVRERVSAGQYIRRVGSDVVSGAPLLAAGTRLTPAALALLAAAGHATAPVHRRPRVAVLSTGDELVPPGRPLGPAQIYDSNGVGLTAQARRAGADVTPVGVLGDDLESVSDALRDALGWADVLVVSGGVSVGARDVVKEAFGRFGRVELWRVAVQPGKPLAFGRAVGSGAETRDVLFFGLPGNPVSSFVTFELFVIPVLRRLTGDPRPLERRVRRARLADHATKDRARRAFLRVRTEPDADRPGEWLARLSGGQSSHVLSGLALADALAVVPEGVQELAAGSEVEVWDLGA